MPYTLEVNDQKFWQSAFGSPDDFESYMRNSFDMLHEEGEECPRMMTVGLHPRIAGRPARARAVDGFLAYINDHPDVWIARRRDIAQWWLDRCPVGFRR